MEMRLVVGYGLLVMMIVGFSALIAWKRFHSHNRAYQRQLKRERETGPARRNL